jgi:DUF1680 family protein
MAETVAPNAKMLSNTLEALAARSPNGLAVIAYGPNELRTAVEGTALTVQTLTEYPFNDRVELIIQPANEIRFELLLRIPGWCNRPKVQVNGLTTEIQKDRLGVCRAESLLEIR